MRTAQQGDRVQVHYVKRLQDGSVASSRGRPPLQLTVGIDHPRLPGLGLALVGLAPGGAASLQIPPEHAYGVSDPSRVHRWSRNRFPQHATLLIGKWVRFTNDRGRRRLVRILEVSDKVVVVDTNRRGAGQTLELEVELLAIFDPDAGIEVRDPDREAPTYSALSRPNAEHPTDMGAAGGTLLPKEAKAMAFDVDATSLASLREAFPGWEFKDVYGATVGSLPSAWNPGAADILVVGVRADVSETLELCRFLAFSTAADRDVRSAATNPLGPPRSLPHPHGGRRARRAGAPLLVLIPSGQETLVEALLEAGAHSCLMLPINAKDVASMLVHARAGNQPGRHTLNLEGAQSEDQWRDDGGQG
jgi:FKBP-type peptidyl-prolyl cis-trans isomerase 2